MKKFTLKQWQSMDDIKIIECLPKDNWQRTLNMSQYMEERSRCTCDYSTQAKPWAEKKGQYEKDNSIGNNIGNVSPKIGNKSTTQQRNTPIGTSKWNGIICIIKTIFSMDINRNNGRNQSKF